MPYDLPISANYAESKLRYKFHMFLLCCMYHISSNRDIPKVDLIAIESIVDPSHRSHNALHKCPAMCRFITEMCTHVHTSVAGWYSGIIELMH